MRRPHPMVAMALCLVAALVGAKGHLPAGVAFAVLLSWTLFCGLSPVPLLKRVAVVALSLSGLLLLTPWVGWRALDLIVRGIVVTTAFLTLNACASWSSLLATLERLGLPRVLVAYLAILARHADTVRDEVVRMHRVVALRGGYRTWRNRVRSWKILMVRLLPEVIRRADRTADALALRGYRGRLPGRLPRPLGAVDFASLGLIAILLTVGVIS